MLNNTKQTLTTFAILGSMLQDKTTGNKNMNRTTQISKQQRRFTKQQKVKKQRQKQAQMQADFSKRRLREKCGYITEVYTDDTKEHLYELYKMGCDRIEEEGKIARQSQTRKTFKKTMAILNHRGNRR